MDWRAAWRRTLRSDIVRRTRSPTDPDTDQMTDERKYREEEVKEIFDLAVSGAEGRGPSASDEGGLTLAELQQVGLEVGVEPGRIAEAARALEARREVLPRRTALGMPVSVGRIVELPRALTEREWELLVSELRETFGARGRVASHGGIREWSNGNLHAFLEPTEAGHRLRLRTTKGSAIAMNRAGVAGMVMGAILLAMVLFVGGVLTVRGLVSLMPALMLLGMGGGALTLNALTLPRWAHEREGQMEYIAARVAAIVAEPPQAEESET